MVLLSIKLLKSNIKYICNVNTLFQKNADQRSYDTEFSFAITGINSILIYFIMWNGYFKVAVRNLF